MRQVIVKIGADGRGNYRRDLGWKVEDGKLRQQRFYLGRDQREATLRYLKLDDCWDAVKRRWQRNETTGRPLWDSVSLVIALSISRGDAEVLIDPGDHFHRASGEPHEVEGVDGPVVTYSVPAELTDPEALLSWFGQLQADFGNLIPLCLVGQAEATAKVKGTARTFRGMAERAEKLARGPQMLHAALDAFAAWHRRKYLDAEGTPSEYAVGCCNQIQTIKQHADNVPLDGFGLSELEGLIDYWRNRPVVARGNKCSVDTAKNHIKRIRAFVRWLHKSPEFDWKKPFDYEVTPVRIPLTPAELAARYTPQQVETYTVEELVTLWAYAMPQERLLMLLALNCGFGQREIGTLQVGQVFLGDESFVKKVRLKSTVYGEWKLWPETVRALRWYLKRRPETSETALLVNKGGRPVVAPTEGGNRNGAIPNAWRRLHARITKDVPKFRSLSFNKLRKTAYDLVRSASDGELAGVFLCHGKPVRTDVLADVYGNRPFGKVFDALAVVRERLFPVFARVPDPFPEDRTCHNPSTSLGTIERMVTMRREGKTYDEIAAACAVTKATVTKYLKQAGLVRKYRRRRREG